MYPGFIKIVKNGIADVRPKICRKFADILNNIFEKKYNLSFGSIISKIILSNCNIFNIYN